MAMIDLAVTMPKLPGLTDLPNQGPVPGGAAPGGGMADPAAFFAGLMVPKLAGGKSPADDGEDDEDE
jgi:hypothetical protein